MAPEEVIVDPEEETGAVDGKVTLVAKANTLVWKANPYRTGGRITNEGEHPAWLSLGTGAALEKSGIYLAPKGGYWDANGFGGEVRAIATEETTLVVAEIGDQGAQTTLQADEAFTPNDAWAGKGLLPPGWTATPGMNGVGDGGFGERIRSPEE